MNIVKKAMATAAVGALALVAVGGAGGIDPAQAKPKSAKTQAPETTATVKPGNKPVDAPAVDIETGQLLIRDKPTARAANPAGGTPPDAPAVDVETGQKLIKDRPTANAAPGDTPPAAAANDLCGLPHTPPCRSAEGATEVETGQKLIKDKPMAKATGAGNNNGLLIGMGAAAVAIGAVLLASGGNDNPASP